MHGASAYDTMLAGDVCSEHFFLRTCCPIWNHVLLCMSSYGAVVWCLLGHAVHCLMWYVISLGIGHCLMVHVVLWGMLYYGAYHLMSYGEYCLLGILSQDACCQWGILSTGILFGAFHLVHHIKAMS